VTPETAYPSGTTLIPPGKASYQPNSTFSSPAAYTFNPTQASPAAFPQLHAYSPSNPSFRFRSRSSYPSNATTYPSPVAFQFQYYPQSSPAFPVAYTSNASSQSSTQVLYTTSTSSYSLNSPAFANSSLSWTRQQYNSSASAAYYTPAATPRASANPTYDNDLDCDADTDTELGFGSSSSAAVHAPRPQKHNPYTQPKVADTTPEQSSKQSPFDPANSLEGWPSLPRLTASSKAKVECAFDALLSFQIYPGFWHSKAGSNSSQFPQPTNSSDSKGESASTNPSKLKAESPSDALPSVSQLFPEVKNSEPFLTSSSPVKAEPDLKSSNSKDLGSLPDWYLHKKQEPSSSPLKSYPRTNRKPRVARKYTPSTQAQPPTRAKKLKVSSNASKFIADSRPPSQSSTRAKDRKVSSSTSKPVALAGKSDKPVADTSLVAARSLLVKLPIPGERLRALEGSGDIKSLQILAFPGDTSPGYIKESELGQNFSYFGKTRLLRTFRPGSQTQSEKMAPSVSNIPSQLC
jgi:hypothetical protein